MTQSEPTASDAQASAPIQTCVFPKRGCLLAAGGCLVVLGLLAIAFDQLTTSESMAQLFDRETSRFLGVIGSYQHPLQRRGFQWFSDGFSGMGQNARGWVEQIEGRKVVAHFQPWSLGRSLWDLEQIEVGHLDISLKLPGDAELEPRAKPANPETAAPKTRPVWLRLLPKRFRLGALEVAELRARFSGYSSGEIFGQNVRWQIDETGWSLNLPSGRIIPTPEHPGWPLSGQIRAEESGRWQVLGTAHNSPNLGIATFRLGTGTSRHDEPGEVRVNAWDLSTSPRTPWGRFTRGTLHLQVSIQRHDHAWPDWEIHGALHAEQLNLELDLTGLNEAWRPWVKRISRLPIDLRARILGTLSHLRLEDVEITLAGIRLVQGELYLHRWRDLKGRFQLTIPPAAQRTLNLIAPRGATATSLKSLPEVIDLTGTWTHPRLTVVLLPDQAGDSSIGKPVP